MTFRVDKLLSVGGENPAQLDRRTAVIDVWIDLRISHRDSPCSSDHVGPGSEALRVLADPIDRARQSVFERDLWPPPQ